jgi:hypothetical protein
VSKDVLLYFERRRDSCFEQPGHKFCKLKQAGTRSVAVGFRERDDSAVVDVRDAVRDHFEVRILTTGFGGRSWDWCIDD